jgi:hypothetical protein
MIDFNIKAAAFETDPGGITALAGFNCRCGTINGLVTTRIRLVVIHAEALVVGLVGKAITQILIRSAGVLACRHANRRVFDVVAGVIVEIFGFDEERPAS